MGARGQAIILIGLRRSGKSTVGRLLAGILGMPFVDLDEVVAAREGMRAGEILLKRGWPEFREAETRALEEVVQGRPAVLAAGGGTAESAMNRELCSRWGKVIYLVVPVPELLDRLGRDPDPGSRPLLAGADAAEETAILGAFRDPFYRAAADLVVDAMGTPEAVCARCAAALRTLHS